MKLYQFIELCADREKLVEFLVNSGVLSGHNICPKCSTVIYLQKEKISYFCRSTTYVKNTHKKRVKVQCNFRRTGKLGTWFGRANLSVEEVCRLCAYFIYLRHPRLEFIMNDLDISKVTVRDWLNLCREVLIHWAENISTPIGGPGIIVEIDEVKYGRRKHNRGRLIEGIEGKWAFVGYERDTKKIFLVPVSERSEETLLVNIMKWIYPGTTIVTDCWKSYDNLGKAGFQHLLEHHNYNFVDPGTAAGAHTLDVEKTWREIRENIPRYGTPKVHLVGYMMEFLFKRVYSYDERLEAFFKEVGRMHPPKIHQPDEPM